MSYQPNIPTGTVNLDEDWKNLRDNFSTLNTIYNTDHVALNAPAGPTTGFHKAVHLVQQVAPAAVAGVSSLYCTTVNDGLSNDQILYYKTGSNKIIQLTRNVLPLAATRGYTFLPGGILIQWDTTTQSSSNRNITFPIAFPANVFNIQLSPQRNSGTISNPFDGFWIDSTTVTTSGFTIINNNTNSFSYSWVAIGN